jgi:hypothetical protein
LANLSASDGVTRLKPLQGFIKPDAPLLDSMTGVTGSADYRDLVRSFISWPPNSLISTHERAILHWLICESRANAVLEIGSYFAGTTLLLATSALETGGRVHTLDPYGQERVPGIIAGWPKSLQDITTYWGKYACDFFVPYLDVPPFDLVLVDGDHSYPNVMHDLFASYENLNASGYIVIDNAEQLEVLDGARDFLKLTPEAQAVRLTITGTDAYGDYITELDTALERNAHSSAFIVVRKPKDISVRRRASTFHLQGYDRLRVDQLEAMVVNVSDQPIELVCKAHLRSLPRDSLKNPNAYEVVETMAATAMPGRSKIAFKSKQLQLPDVAASGNNFVDVSLYTLNEDAVLQLLSFKIDGHTVKTGRNFLRNAA